MSTDGSVVIATTQGFTIVRSLDFGITFDSYTNPETPTVLYGAIGCSASAAVAVVMSNVGKGKRTADFGATWAVIDFSTITKQPTSGACGAVVSVDGTIMLVVSTFLAKSVDSGLTFTQLQPPVEIAAFSTSASFLSSDRGDRAYFTHFDTTNFIGYLFRSLDFGFTWTAMNSPDIGLKFTSISFDLSGLNGVAAISTSTDLLLITSRDGGITWQIVSGAAGTGASGFCQDYNTGQYISTNNGWNSVDFGATFQFSAFPISNTAYNFVSL